MESKIKRKAYQKGIRKKGHVCSGVRDVVKRMLIEILPLTSHI
ncbi:MAG: hypothetical protein WCC17_17540 [Candidatus Nitrosopolaris sp.]